MYVYFADSTNGFNARKLLDPTQLGADHTISSVVPADFDGDLAMDLLITFADQNQLARIYWGNGESVSGKHCTFLKNKIK